MKELQIETELYNQKNRQMILADIIEYAFLGRGYYAVKSKEDKQNFIKVILHLVNILMTYELLTVNTRLRVRFLKELKKRIREIGNEEKFNELLKFKGPVGLKKGETKAPKELNLYFDKLLPKTAGGLWHELLVYIFILRNNYGYIIPLLLHQRLLNKQGHIVPPDFLIISKDKRIYGIEVGTKKEIQSGSFSLVTSIPTATVDTENSRNSDRCPICKAWIQFCPFVINNYSDFEYKIDKTEVKCLMSCNLYTSKEIINGKCPYSKYSRQKTSAPYTKHKYADGLHYHYACVLNKVSKSMNKKIRNHPDKTAIKTHYPHYSGLGELGQHGFN
ncbi:MAG: hypothetical protein WHT45_08000 [Ignavibacterium sp.]